MHCPNRERWRRPSEDDEVASRSNCSSTVGQPVAPPAPTGRGSDDEPEALQGKSNGRSRPRPIICLDGDLNPGTVAARTGVLHSDVD